MYAMLAGKPNKNERLRPAWTLWYRNPISILQKKKEEKERKKEEEEEEEEKCLSLIWVKE